MSTLTGIAEHGDIAVEPYGDAALLVRIPGGGTDTWDRMHRISNSIGAADLPGIEGLVAAYDSLLIEYDPYVISPEELDSRIRNDAADFRPLQCRVHRVPAIYGGAHGPDLDDVAAELDLTAAEFIEVHASTQWKVAFRGAPAGAPMLAGAPFDRPIRRCAQPRIRVPAGSVAVAGLQGVIYPIQSPGGWRLVARTPLDVIDIRRDPHLRYRPGDVFEFVPITEREAERFNGTLLGDDGA